jgi:hypothetical protein
MRPAEFELPIPAIDGLQTHALDRAATGIGVSILMDVTFINKMRKPNKILLAEPKLERTI